MALFFNAPLSFIARGVGIVLRLLPNVQGSVSGYTSGGYNQTGSPSYYSNVIDKFPFASDGNATDVGDLSVTRSGSAGQSSPVSGYTSGGFSYSPDTGSTYHNVIDKFPFASDGNATDVGDMTVGRNTPATRS